MKGIKIQMVITFTKSMATLTLILGFILSLVSNDNQPFTAAVAVVMVIVTGQNLGDSLVKSKCNNQNKNNNE